MNFKEGKLYRFPKGCKRVCRATAGTFSVRRTNFLNPTLDVVFMFLKEEEEERDEWHFNRVIKVLYIDEIITVIDEGGAVFKNIEEVR